MNHYSKGLEYELVSTGDKYIVTGIGSCKDRDIAIPPFYRKKPVFDIAAGAFAGCAIRNVLIPNSVTSIGDGAFSRCKSLRSVAIPNSVTSIGYSAFYGCSSLASITIPDSVTIIRGAAFYSCSELTSITIPDSVTNIGVCAFDNCIGLTNVTIGNGVTRIGGDAFWGCRSLRSVTIPNNVKSIGDSAFHDCTNLKSPENNYKAFSIVSGKLNCRDKIYTVGKKSVCKGPLELCENGIHCCTNIFDIFNYYSGEYGKDFVIGICDVSDENIGGHDDSKRCVRWVIPNRILTREEVINIMNEGSSNG